MDLSKLSDEDLRAISSGDLSRVSDDALRMLAGQQQPNIVTEQAPGISISYPTDQPAPPPERTSEENLARQFGLTARAGITGATGIPMMAGDALNALINSIAGTNLPPATQSLQNLMTQAGLPKPETKVERISGDVAASLAGIPGLGFTAQALAPQYAAPLLQNIGLQTTGALGGTTSASLGREEGLSPMAQLGLAGVAGTLAPTGASMVAGRAGTAAKEVVRPFTQAGREKIAGEVLRGLAREPDVAALNAANYQARLPGYQPTTAQATRDVGLIAAETPVRALDTTGRFAQQAAQANQARMVILDRLAKTSDDMTAAIQKRDEVTAPLREAAFARSTVDPETFQSGVTLTVNKTIDDILSSDVGARGTVIKAMNWAQDQIKRGTTPARLYEVRKDLRDAAQGLLDKEGSALVG